MTKAARGSLLSIEHLQASEILALLKLTRRGKEGGGEKQHGEPSVNGAVHPTPEPRSQPVPEPAAS